MVRTWLGRNEMESSTVALEHEHRIVQKVVAGMAMLADELEKGIPVKDICRENGISNATFFNWKAKYGVDTQPAEKAKRA